MFHSSKFSCFYLNPDETIGQERRWLSLEANVHVQYICYYFSSYHPPKIGAPYNPPSAVTGIAGGSYARVFPNLTTNSSKFFWPRANRLTHNEGSTCRNLLCY